MRFSVISRKCFAGFALTGAALSLAGCSETASTPGKSPMGPPKGTAHVSSTTGPSKGREVPEAAPVGDEKPSQEKSDGE
jgi:hypothetical protein